MSTLSLSLTMGAVGGPSTLAQRALSAIRRNGGTLLLPGASTPVLGKELVTTPNIALSTAGIGIGPALVAGKAYKVEFTVSDYTGTGDCGLDGPTFTAAPGVTRLSGNGTARGIVVAAGGPNIGLFTRVTNSATFSNISVKEILSYTHGNPPLRNYLDSAGTDILDSVTQVDQPVGLCLDSMGVLGPELAPAINLSNWQVSGADATHIVTVSNGTVRYQSDTTSPQLAFGTQQPCVTVGKTYLVTVVCSAWTSGAVKVFENSGGTLSGVNGVGTFSGVVPASQAYIALTRATASVDLTISSISVREVTGNHATQPTTASKPLLRRGLVNQLLWSGDFSNAAWAKTAASVASNATPAPGGGTCFKLTEDTTANFHTLNQATSTTIVSGVITHVAVLKAGERTSALVQAYDNAGITRGRAIFDLLVGTVVASTAGTASITHLGDGWYLCAVVSNAFAGTHVGQFWVRPTIGTTETYAGDGTSGILLHRAALFQGTVTAAQILAAGGIPVTTTAPASSTAGKPYWEFDGSNDFLQTGITTGNEGWICAGVTFGGASAAIESIAGSGANAPTTKGVWLARIGLVSENTLWMATGTGATRNIAAKTDAPLRGIPRVIDGGWAATTCFAAVDGIESSATRSGDLTPPPTGLQIGAVSGSAQLSAPMSAALYFSVLPSAADRAILRKWVGSLQGQTL